LNGPIKKSIIILSGKETGRNTQREMKRAIILFIVLLASISGFSGTEGGFEIKRTGSFLVIQSDNEVFALISSFDSNGRNTDHLDRIAVNINNIISIDRRESSGFNYIIRIFVDRNREAQYYQLTISSSYRAETAYKSIIDALSWEPE
jgi:hypothetical protein